MDESDEQIKAMIVMSIVDNCTIKLDNNSQQSYQLNEQQFSDCVDIIFENVKYLKTLSAYKKEKQVKL